MDKNDVIQEVVGELQKFQLQLPNPSYNYQQLHEALATHINYLITTDFSLLISILYRLDISEKKLKQFLNQSTDTTAGDIIAQMIIERQLQKIESRKAFKSNDYIPDNEKW